MQTPELQRQTTSAMYLPETVGFKATLFTNALTALQQDIRKRCQALEIAKAQRNVDSATRECHDLQGVLGEVNPISTAYLVSLMKRAAAAADWETFDLAFGVFIADASLLEADIRAHLDLELLSSQDDA